MPEEILDALLALMGEDPPKATDALSSMVAEPADEMPV
jgi:hypothetical protein